MIKRLGCQKLLPASLGALLAVLGVDVGHEGAHDAEVVEGRSPRFVVVDHLLVLLLHRGPDIFDSVGIWSAGDGVHSSCFFETGQVQFPCHDMCSVDGGWVHEEDHLLLLPFVDDLL